MNFLFKRWLAIIMLFCGIAVQAQGLNIPDNSLETYLLSLGAKNGHSEPPTAGKVSH